MTWEQFLESNQYDLDHEEWDTLDDDDRVYMNDIIDEFIRQLDHNQERAEEIIHIEQEEPGSPFEAWTKRLVYFWDYERDNYVVSSANRNPPHVVVE